MPSQSSPPPGYLSATAGRTGGSAPGGPPPASPSWLKVIGTTLRLWLRRRVLRVPDSGKVSAARQVSLAAGIVVIAAAVAAAVLTVSPSRPAASSVPARPRAVPAAVAAERHAATANMVAAAAWISAEVSQQATVVCDPGMSGQLEADGFPPAGEIVQAPGAALPAAPAGQPGGPAATVVAATQTLDAQYGPELAALAPVVLASFGTGPGRVQVRLAVPGGAAAAAADEAAAQAARRTAGQALVRSGRARMHAAAAHELTGGDVDPRLITVLRKVAAAASIYIISFASPGQAGSGPVSQAGPLRMAQIDGLASHGRNPVSELKAALRLLRAEHSPYQAKLTVTHPADGKVVLTIEFPAPSPF